MLRAATKWPIVVSWTAMDQVPKRIPSLHVTRQFREVYCYSLKTKLHYGGFMSFVWMPWILFLEGRLCNNKYLEWRNRGVWCAIFFCQQSTRKRGWAGVVVGCLTKFWRSKSVEIVEEFEYCTIHFKLNYIISMILNWFQFD